MLKRNETGGGNFMKKLIIFGLFALAGWTSYYDITVGTLNFLPGTHRAEASPSVLQTNGQIYRTVTIEPGDTVLSVHERLNPGAHIAIEKVLNDFQKLNGGRDPNHIQIGASYRFPVYGDRGD